MESNILIRTLRLKNLLSYGSDADVINLEPLNVLIGPNASGKSNLIEAVGILRAIPTNLKAYLREGGGISEWLWKGRNKDPIAEIEATVNYREGPTPLRYEIRFTRVGQRVELVDEVIECEERSRPDADDVYFFYRYQQGNPVLNVRTVSDGPVGTREDRTMRTLRREDLSPEQSVLAQRKDMDHYPELTLLANQFSKIKLYREWNLGRYTPARLPQKADLPIDFLLEDASNLGLVLNDLQHQQGIKQLLLKEIRNFQEGVEDITTKIYGGTVQIFLHESPLSQPVPATRLSDGILRYLCLLAILCHPYPPPLVCIEEPELGMHPDIIPRIAELLIEASQRTQLIVTTHSDVLVSALTEVPQSVLVCERSAAGSRLRRLEQEQLAAWLEKYTLGELWRMGEIGGTQC